MSKSAKCQSNHLDRENVAARGFEMTAQITLTLPESVLQRAERLAQRMGRPVDEVLVQVIASSLSPLGEETDTLRPIDEWTEKEVLAAADLQMSEEDDRRLSDLLNRQQARSLTSSEHAELAARMLAYQDGLLQKAQGLREAVRRGLRAPVQP